MHVTQTPMLTHTGAMAMLAAAVAEAVRMGQPQCIVIVDASCVPLVEFRMTGSKPLSINSARAKAQTAASIGAETVNIPEAVRTGIGLATGGAVTGLPGGLPIVVDGAVIGGIGIGSGSGDQDIAVAKAALAALSA
ncbi:hypothetical protein JANAI62_09330 [Jannaschia pagri]|uniref:Glc operon protein GlcG n=1 Tax=Jannaschia pagri TaxID=2829797 RepID=A0ABQ4NIR9_9RHOB|nr:MULTISPECIES: heme-binding protein [unclassified Jannaschia]GIT89582.1 hypothetical protein JANAI61_00400 [Jannaschia sp. AI_61]GIT94310.1 hypothetical protein JANAI62_09330 [Jannaschia sp. AI_62]